MQDIFRQVQQREQKAAEEQQADEQKQQEAEQKQQEANEERRQAREKIQIAKRIQQEEEKKQGGDAINLAFRQIVERENLQPFEDGDFNIDNLVDLFNDDTNIFAEGVEPDFLNAKGATVKFEKLVGDALSKAFQSRDPTQIRAVFSTLGRVSSAVERGEIGFSPSEFIENIISEQFPVERLAQLQGRILQPVDVGELIDSLFDVELSSLSVRNLSQEEIASIRTEFRNDLSELEQNISTDVFGNFIFGENTLRMLQEYINSTVENNQLRQLLLGDIQLQIAEDRSTLGIQLGEAPPQLTPLSATRTQVLREPHAENISRIFGDELRKIDAAQSRINRSKTKPVRLKAIQADRVRDAVAIFNNFAEKNAIRNLRTGLPIRIETERKEEFVVGQEDPVIRVVPVPIEDLITTLNEMTKALNRATLSFEYVPTLIRDPSTGTTRESIIKDIIDMERMMTKTRNMLRKPKKQLISSMHRRAKFANAEVLTAKRRIQKDMMGNIAMGAQMREIRIQSGITLGELAKIANMIAMENGSLEDIHQQPLLDIRKGITPIQEIVNAIMIAQKHAGGNDFSVIFVPVSPVGGLHLGGSLDVINKNRMLVSPVGGNIFNTIGSLVKGAASVPLALVSSIFGGALPNDRRALAKPIFGHLPIARRKTAPQIGGALTNVFGDRNNTFIQGEHQPEPFISSGGDNQIYHIQPFPFGGRIDNTGFIDQSQMNPKFPWLDVPIISLTTF